MIVDHRNPRHDNLCRCTRCKPGYQRPIDWSGRIEVAMIIMGGLLFVIAASTRLL